MKFSPTYATLLSSIFHYRNNIATKYLSVTLFVLLLFQQHANSIYAPITIDAELLGSLMTTTYSINFNTDPAGNILVAGTTNFAATQPYQNLYGTGSGVTFTTNNPINKPLNLYDTEGLTNEDDDLERNSTGTGLWEGGNLTNEPLNNALIINKNNNISVPNDNASGGQVILNSDVMLSSLSFTFVDLDDNRVASSTIIFTNTVTNETTTIGFSDLEGSSTSVFSTPGADFGNRNANSINAITAADLGISEFNQVNFSQTGSGGIGSILLETSTIICPPTICLPINFTVIPSNN